MGGEGAAVAGGCAHEGVGKWSLVEGVGAAVGDLAQGFSEIRLVEQGAGPGRDAVGEKAAGAGGVLGKGRTGAGDGLGGIEVDGDAMLGEFDGRDEGVGHANGAVAIQNGLPGADGARDGGGVDAVGRDFVVECVDGEARGRGAAGVDGDGVRGAGGEAEGKGVTADMVGAGLGDGDDRGRRDDGIKGIAAVAQGAQAGFGREGMSAGDHGASANDGGALGGPARVGGQA